MTRVIVFTNHKGGVGKSTRAYRGHYIPSHPVIGQPAVTPATVEIPGRRMLVYSPNAR